MFVTGFGPFGSVQDNPSAHLAENCGLPFRVLEVSFRGVDEFVDDLGEESFDSLLMIGVAAGADMPRLETVARNFVGAGPDVRGVVGGPGPIDPALPPRCAASLWTAEELWEEGRPWTVSVDAGDYLCNYAFFRAATRFPDKKVGFLHVPSQERLPLPNQRDILAQILRLVRRLQ